MLRLIHWISPDSIDINRSFQTHFKSFAEKRRCRPGDRKQKVDVKWCKVQKIKLLAVLDLWWKCPLAGRWPWLQDQRLTNPISLRTMALNGLYLIYLIGSFRNDTWWKLNALRSTVSTRSASICARWHLYSFRAWGVGLMFMTSWHEAAAGNLPLHLQSLGNGANWNPRVKSPYCLASLKQLSDILTFSFRDVCQKKAKGPRTECIEVASLPVLLPVRYTVGSAAPGPHLSVWNRFKLKKGDKKST